MPSGGTIRAGRAAVELFADNSKLIRGLRQAERKVKNFGRGVLGIARNVAGVGALMTAPFLKAAQVFASTGDALDKMAKRTGISVESLSTLGFAAEQTGSNMQTLGKAVLRMNRRIGRITAGQASKTQVEALEELGLSAEQLDKLSPEQQLKAIADAMKSYGDDAEAAGLAQRAFGTQVDDILPLLKQGKEGIEALQQEARDLNLGFSQDEAAGAAKLTDALNKVRKVALRVVSAIGSAVAPALSGMLDWLAKNAAAAITWIKHNKRLIVALAATGVAITVLGGALATLGAAIVGVGIVIGSLATILGVIGSVLGALLSPIGLVVAAVAGLGATLLVATGLGGKAIRWFGEQFNWMKKTALLALDGIVNALKAGDIQLAAKIAWTALKLGFAKALEGIKGIWRSVETWLVKKTTKIWTDIQAAIKIAVTAIQNTFFRAVKALADAWQKLLDFMKPGTKWVAETMARVMGHIQGTPQEVIDQTIENQLDKNVDRELNKQKDALDNLKANAQSDIDQNQSDLEKDLTDLLDKEKDKLDRTDKSNEQARKAGQARIDRLESTLKELVQQAADEAADKTKSGEGSDQEQPENPDEGPPGADGNKSQLDKLKNQLAGGAEAARAVASLSSGGVRGTFRTSRVSERFGGQRVEVGLLKEIRDGIQPIRRGVEDLREQGGASFA